MVGERDSIGDLGVHVICLFGTISTSKKPGPIPAPPLCTSGRADDCSESRKPEVGLSQADLNEAAGAAADPSARGCSKDSVVTEKGDLCDHTHSADARRTRTDRKSVV